MTILLNESSFFLRPQKSLGKNREKRVAKRGGKGHRGFSHAGYKSDRVKPANGKALLSTPKNKQSAKNEFPARGFSRLCDGAWCARGISADLIFGYFPSRESN
jgi:hypothetical protein